ncbi:four helix bundle protein [Mariniflexile sp. HMF6888]|uniref:four helix bundle protein n=1 Tax=Mariniflexile sp. HMF6888 TaxID=3373086 RepID=UPI0037926CAD
MAGVYGFCYNITEQFPSKGTFGLTSQLRRALVSIPSNFAEGAGRKGGKEFSRFLYIVLGSLSEVETSMLKTPLTHRT